MSKVQGAGSTLRVGFTMSKWPHFHRVYLVTVCKRSYIAVCWELFPFKKIKGSPFFVETSYLTNETLGTPNGDKTLRCDDQSDGRTEEHKDTVI